MLSTETYRLDYGASLILASQMMIDAGQDLDRQIERKLNGDAKKKTPPYSTSEKAASRLLRRLEMQDMPCSIEQVDSTWYCTLWIVLPKGRERLATGSGETRALSVARAVMNARLGMGATLSVTGEAVSRRVLWATGSPAGPHATITCEGCGVSLPTRNREGANRFCTVCSWRAGRNRIAATTTSAGAIPIEPEKEPSTAVSE
jgi:hypothetical protein